jgi:hypothetical protein
LEIKFRDKVLVVGDWGVANVIRSRESLVTFTMCGRELRRLIRGVSAGDSLRVYNDIGNSYKKTRLVNLI